MPQLQSSVFAGCEGGLFHSFVFSGGDWFNGWASG